ncbi:hypothetical protein JCM6882_007566 [Rhodosporidiobolus microsporus]
MTTSISPRCCVCGTTTINRCSSCAKFGFDLFFCSREHQKVIWPVRKLCCGERASPFRWPDLSKQEIEFLYAIKDFPLEGFGHNPQGRAYLSLGDLLRRANPLGSLEAVVYKLVTQPDHPDVFWLSRQLRTLRSAQLLYQTETAGQTLDPSLPNSQSCPTPRSSLFAGQYMAQISQCARNVLGRAMRAEDLDWKVDTRLHHLALVLGLAKEKRLRSKEEGTDAADEAEKFFQDAFANVTHYVREDLPKTDKEAARLLWEFPDLVKEL